MNSLHRVYSVPLLSGVSKMAQQVKALAIKLNSEPVVNWA